MSDAYEPMVDWMRDVLDECPRHAGGFVSGPLVGRIAAELHARPGQAWPILGGGKGGLERVARRLRQVGVEACLRGSTLVAGVQCSLPRRRSAHLDSLTPDQVVEIRNSYALGLESAAELGARFGVHAVTVRNAAQGVTYLDADGPIAPLGARPGWSLLMAARQGTSTMLDDAILEKLEKYDMAVALGLIED